MEHLISDYKNKAWSCWTVTQIIVLLKNIFVDLYIYVEMNVICA